MKIAITGAAGYIGGWLARTLRERGHEVATQDVLPGQGALFDLAYEQCRRYWLAKESPELLIHLAAKYGRVWGEQGMEETASVNAGLTAEIARDCATMGIRLMYMSSSEVYGATAAHERGEISESMPLRPLNMYGLSKKWGEEACRAYAPDGLVITRLNMPYGPAAVLPPPGTVPRHSGRVGDRGYNALHTFLWQAHHGMPIIAHTGTERCFTWIGDTCEALALIAESGQAGTWNVCRNDEPVYMADLAYQCQALTGSLSQVIEKEPDGQVTPYKRLDSSKLWQLGWRPKVHLADGMQEALAYVSMFDRAGKWLGDAV